MESGRPFSGITGKQLDRALLEVGLDRDKLFVVNAVLCFPGDGKTSRRMATAVKCCKAAFEYQIARYRKAGKHFFTGGYWAALAVLGREVSLETGRGFLR